MVEAIVQSPEGTRYNVPVAGMPFHLRSKGKSASAGIELTATALVSDTWVIVLR